jgi:hypothetical protein
MCPCWWMWDSGEAEYAMPVGESAMYVLKEWFSLVVVQPEQRV